MTTNRTDIKVPGTTKIMSEMKRRKETMNEKRERKMYRWKEKWLIKWKKKQIRN